MSSHNVPEAAAAAAMEVDEEEDPVVTSIDVYMGGKLANLLALAQFPLRPAWHGMPKVAGARIKPQQVRFELDCQRVRDDHYDANSDHALPPDQKHKDTVRSLVVPLQTNYAVGVLREGKDGNEELHLTPVYTVMQMRPTFAALDEADRKRQEEEAEADGKDAVKESEEAPVQITFKRKEAPKSAAAKRLTALARERRDEDEKFVNLKFLDPSSAEHGVMLDQLVSNQRDAEVAWNVSRGGYLDLLAPTPPVEQYLRRQHELMMRENLSLEDLRKMAPAQRVRALMLAAGVLSFRKVVELAQCPGGAKETLNHLQNVAVIAGQRWVARSDIAAQGGFVNVREWALWCMHEGQHVTRRMLEENTGAAGTTFTRMLSKFAVQDRAHHTWVLKGAPDTEFVSDPKYADIPSDSR
eukprot:m51a1_g12809 hypothetical protein (411) ;mRNA; r:22-2392